jgi:hypothetical protein
MLLLSNCCLAAAIFACSVFGVFRREAKYEKPSRSVHNMLVLLSRITMIIYSSCVACTFIANIIVVGSSESIPVHADFRN